MGKREKTDYIVVHCSATTSDKDIGAHEIREWHLGNGWSDIGYHYVIRRDGTVENGRQQSIAGAHVAGFNSVSVGVCLVGGANKQGRGEDNFTLPQMQSLKKLLLDLKEDYPRAMILGHRDLSPDLNHDGKITSNEWIKECPSFDVAKWLERERIR
jgi:N-acetyl-anhydromuramyl-L-alanine amidase AmpD